MRKQYQTYIYNSNFFWNDILADNLGKFNLTLNALNTHQVYEFNYINDLCAFDSEFFENVNSDILQNITSTLNCSRSDIKDISPINAGLTNLSVLFSVNGTQYVYRHPGEETDAIINREPEAYALKVAYKLGLDETYVHIDQASSLTAKSSILSAGNTQECAITVTTSVTSLHRDQAIAPRKL